MSTIVEYVLNLRGNLSQQVDNAANATQRLDSAMGSAKNAAMSLGGAMGIAFGAAGVAMFVNKMVQAGTTVENAQTGLTTLLKNSDEAAGVISKTLKDAAETPFAFEGLLAANKALISAGIESGKAREDVLNLANAIAATGGGDVELQRMVVNMQQISNTGKATAMDIKQFAFAGVNIYKVLAEATGKPIEKVKDMEVSYDLLTMALKKAHEKGGIYFNGLENMSKNTSVTISNVGDSIFQFFNKIFTTSKPLIDSVLKTVLNGIESISSGFDSAVKFVNDYGSGILFVVGTLATYKGIMLGIMALEKSAMGIKIASAVASELLLAWDMARAEGLGVLSAAQWALNVAMNANPIGLIVMGIAALVAGVMALANHFGGLGNMITGVWEIIKAFGKGVGGVFYGIGEIIAGIFNPALIAKGMKDIVDSVATAGTEIGNAWNKNTPIEIEKGKSIIPGKQGAAGKTGAAAEAIAAPKTKAEGQKTINIHVAYNAPLIKDFTISTTNVKEGLGNLKDQVSAILVGATHDALMVADY